MLAKRKDTKKHLKEGFLKEGGGRINYSINNESMLEMQESSKFSE